MVRIIAHRSFAFSVLALACASPCPAQNPAADRYFGHIQTPCRGADDAASRARCAEFRNKLLDLAKCTTIDKPCPQGTAVLEAVFSAHHTPALPNYIVYLDQTKGHGVFAQHPPRLMWNRRSTPHLYGVRDVFVLAFSEHKVCADAVVTTELKTEPNPLNLVFTAIGSKLAAPPAAEKPPPAPVQDRKPLSWFPLSGDERNSPMWLGFARASVQDNSVNRIVLQFNPKPKPKPEAQAAKSTTEKTTVEKGAGKKTTVEKTTTDKSTTERTTTEEIPAERTTTERTSVDGGKAETREECTGSVPAAYSGDTTGANAFFSNSPASRVDVAAALALTTGTKEASVASGRNQHFNAYVLVKYYHRRAQLRADLAESSTYRRSLAAFVGTSVNHPFDEFLVGISLGHIQGHVGLIGGLNSMIGAGPDRSRKWHPFVGVEYAF